jgi:WD40 repeat protein
VATLQGHTNWVTACAVTPDGRHVVSASEDQTPKVWELASGRPVATLQGDTNWVMACAVTPDVRHVVSASEDHTLKVWELATYTCRLTHRGDVSYLAIVVTATAILASDHAGTVWFLDLPPLSVTSPSGPAPQPLAQRQRSPRQPPLTTLVRRPAPRENDSLWASANTACTAAPRRPACR